MALEAVQAQAGHRSIESTRVYLHLANGWLAGEYARAVDGDRSRRRWGRAPRRRARGDGGLPAARPPRILVAAYEADLWDIGSGPTQGAVGRAVFCAHIGDPQHSTACP